MNDIIRGTSRGTLINSLVAPPHRKAKHGHNAIPNVIFGLVMSDSRLDDEQSVAVIEFSDTPAWLQEFNDDPFGFPKKTPLGTLWRGVDRVSVDEHGQTEFIRAVIKGTPNLHYAEMLAEFNDTDVNVQDENGKTALHWACTENLSEMVKLCLSVPECDIGLKDCNGLTAFDLSMRVAGGNEVIPTIFYNNMFEIEETHPQAALLRVLTVTSEPAVAGKSVFPGAAMFDPVRDSNVPLVKALVERGVDLTACDIDGNTALHVAAKVGNTETAKILLQAGSDVNARGCEGATPLHYAIHSRNRNLVQALLDREAEPTTIDNKGKTALQLAEDINDEELVILLKAVGVNKTVGERKSIIQETVPTVMATEKQKPLRAFLGDIETKNTYGYTPLSQAALDGDLDIVQLLLDMGADTEAHGEDGRTVLCLAVSSGNPDIVSILLTRGANPQAADNVGETAMHIAARNGKEEIVKILLRGGALVETGCHNGQTALHAAASNGHTNTIMALLAGGAQTEALNETGNTSLYVAASKGHTEVVKALLAGGAQPESANQSGNTSLHLAAWNRHTEMVEALLAGGAKTETVDQSGNTSLHFAAWKGPTEVVKALLASGAQTETVAQSGKTPLHFAASYGHTEVVKTLLAAGAQIEARSPLGTPLQLATGAGHRETAKVLVDAGAHCTTASRLGYILRDFLVYALGF